MDFCLFCLFKEGEKGVVFLKSRFSWK